MAEMTTEARLAKVETDIVLLTAGQNELKGDVAAFRDEWRLKAEEDRKSSRAARLTLPQVVAMIGTAVVVTGAMLGGFLWLVNTQVAASQASLTGQVQAVRQSGEAGVAQVGLSVRGMGDSVTALNTAIQSVQRDQGEIKVELGLVKQQSAANTKFIDQAQSFDAQWARHDEKLRALEQKVRDIAASKPPS